MEAVYNQIEGLEVISGYAGGSMKNPSYQEVCAGNTGHAEVVKVIFNPTVITLKTILDIFFQMHNPTTLNRQGNDIGTQYRSIILYTSDKEKIIILEAMREAQKKGTASIVTEVVKLDKFYKAEEYHQQYYKRNPNQGYCKVMIQPKIVKLKKIVLPKLEYSDY